MVMIRRIKQTNTIENSCSKKTAVAAIIVEGALNVMSETFQNSDGHDSMIQSIYQLALHPKSDLLMNANS